MSDKADQRYGDVALLLYVAPFILNFAYALYLWSGAGLSGTLPQLVYLEVTQNPYVFIVGFCAVLLAAIIDFNAEPLSSKRAGVISLSKRLQLVAFSALVLAFISALYSAGGNVGNGFLYLAEGRYPLVFPAVLVFFSFMILPAVKIKGANLQNLLIVVLLVASPAALYELGKRNAPAGIGGALILILAAAFLLVRTKKSD